MNRIDLSEKTTRHLGSPHIELKHVRSKVTIWNAASAPQSKTRRRRSHAILHPKELPEKYRQLRRLILKEVSAPPSPLPTKPEKKQQSHDPNNG